MRPSWVVRERLIPTQLAQAATTAARQAERAELVSEPVSNLIDLDPESLTAHRDQNAADPGSEPVMAPAHKTLREAAGRGRQRHSEQKCISFTPTTHG